MQQGLKWRLFNSKAIGWNLYFQSSSVNPKNYSHPIQNFISLQYKTIRMSTTKIMSLFIRSEEIETDTGSIFEDLTKLVSYSFDSTELDDYDIPGDSLMEFNIFSSNRKPIYNRKYIKLQNILANIGGLARGLMLAMNLITFYFSNVNLNVALMNNIFDFPIL